MKPDTEIRLSEQGRKKYAELRRRAVHQARVWGYTGADARNALLAARAWDAGETRKPIYTPAKIWSRDVTRSNGGRVFAAHGESACRWIENPDSVGLRLVGLAHDVFPRGVEHRGWYLHPDGLGETVAGVVYQLPARDGRARYLAGYADPYNADSDGRGPALLSLEVFEAEPEYCESGFWYDGAEDARQEAARRADAIAGAMAEAEREYQEGWSAGQRARELAREALEAGRELVAVCRDARALWKLRRGVQAIPGPVIRKHLRASLARVRAAREAYQEALEAAREARDEKPAPWFGQDCPALEGWQAGYSEG